MSHGASSEPAAAKTAANLLTSHTAFARGHALIA